MIILLLQAQEPTKKKRKETKKVVPTTVIDTISVNVAERMPVDTIAMEQRIMLKELDERIEIQKKKK